MSFDYPVSTVRLGNAHQNSLQSNCVHLTICDDVGNGVKFIYTEDELLGTSWSIVTIIRS